MTRREWLAAAACASTLRARSHIDRSSISAITDEIGLTTDQAIAFAHEYGLHFVEIRNPPGSRKEYFSSPRRKSRRTPCASPMRG